MFHLFGKGLNGIELYLCTYTVVHGVGVWAGIFIGNFVGGWR